MIKTKTSSETQVLLEQINNAIKEKQGIDLINISLEKIENAVAKYFIICHGNSNTHVNTIADYVQRHVKTQLKENPWQKEGFENSQWILLDFVDVVVHIFQKEYRDFYKLEELWGDCEIIKIENNIE